MVLGASEPSNPYEYIIRGEYFRMKKRILCLSLVLMLLLGMTAVAATAAPTTWKDVGNFSQLKAALTDATTTGIRMTGNIQIAVCGIDINPSKPELVIDGNGFTLTDYNSNCLTDTIVLSSLKTLKNITVRNLNVAGRNYYGFLAIYCIKGVTTRYENVTYTGPQMAYNRYGTVEISNCNINLVNGYCSSGGEVAEAYKVSLMGHVNISKNQPSNVDEIFWLTSCPDTNGGISIAPGAVVIVDNAKSKTNKSGFAYFSCSGNYFTFGEDSVFNYNGIGLFQECCPVGKFSVGKNAQVNILVNGSIYCCHAPVYVNGTLTVGENSVFTVVFPTNTDTTPIVALKDGSKLNINNPKYMLLYQGANKSTCDDVLQFICKTGDWFSKAGKISFWKSSAGVSYTNPQNPTYSWFNANGSNFDVTARITSDGKIASLATARYTGALPLNTTNFRTEGINVIEINGASDLALIKQICKDALDGTILRQSEVWVPTGDYGLGGEFAPPTIPGYTFKAMEAGSDPVQGIILPGQVKTITYLYESVKKDISGSVVWVDNNNSNNTRPATLPVRLLRDGVVVATVDVDPFGNGTFSFAGQPQFASDGHEYVYTVSAPSQQDRGYHEPAVAGTTITMTLKKVYVTCVYLDAQKGTPIYTDSFAVWYNGSITLHSKAFVTHYLISAPEEVTLTGLKVDTTHTYFYLPNP